MATHDYVFVTRWTVDGTPDEIYEVISDAAALPRWWPSVYLEASIVEPGSEGGIGRVVALWTKGFLPYTLRWRFRVAEARRPSGLALEAVGDFVGRGVWSFAAASDGDQPRTNVTFDWRIRAEKPLLRGLSFLLKPIFAANHAWAMERGLESLRLELARRRAANDEERARIPPPPQPSWPHQRRRQRVIGGGR
jgi:hypothetical protein